MRQYLIGTRAANNEVVCCWIQIFMYLSIELYGRPSIKISADTIKIQIEIYPVWFSALHVSFMTEN